MALAVSESAGEGVPGAAPEAGAPAAGFVGIAVVPGVGFGGVAGAAALSRGFAAPDPPIMPALNIPAAATTSTTATAAIRNTLLFQIGRPLGRGTTAGWAV